MPLCHIKENKEKTNCVKTRFNPQNTGGGCNQDAADSIACRSVCGKVRSVKLGVFVVYYLVNTWMKKKMGGCI